MNHLRKSRVAAKYVAILDQPVRGNDALVRVLVQPQPGVPAITVIRRVR